MDKKHPDKVCLLKRSSYGLKQSPRQWNTRFNEFMVQHDFRRSNFDMYLYFKEMKDKQCVFLLLYVDDILIASKGRDYVKQYLERSFRFTAVP